MNNNHNHHSKLDLGEIWDQVPPDYYKNSIKGNLLQRLWHTRKLKSVIDPEKVLREIKRVLANDGIAIIKMDSGNFLFKVVWYLWTNVRNGVWHHSHIYPFDAKKLERMIVKNGFTIAQKKTFNFSMAVAFNLKIKK